jgi:hypothetical protein
VKNKIIDKSKGEEPIELGNNKDKEKRRDRRSL